jgi:hypothetical protein
MVEDAAGWPRSRSRGSAAATVGAWRPTASAVGGAAGK